MEAAEDKTADYFKFREEHRKLISKILADRMDALERSAKREPVIDSIGSFLASRLSGDAYCLSCGQSFHMFSPEMKCCICKRSFCATCLRKENDRELLDLIDPTLPEDSFSCEKCTLFCVLQKEKEFRKKFRSLKEGSPFLPVYSSVAQTKDQLKQLLPQYQYLATSITEIKIAGSSEKDDSSFGISYPQAKLKEKKILLLLKDFEEGIKQFDTIKTKPTSTKDDEIDKLLRANVKKSFSNFLQNTLIAFQDCQKKVAKVELKSVIHVYTFLRTLEYETRAHPNFNARFKKLLDEVSEHVLREVNQICTVQAQRDWEKTKLFIESTIKKNQQVLLTSPQSALIPPKEKKSHKDSIASTPEPLLMRKVIALLTDQHKRFITRSIHAPITAKGLSFVLSKLERGYDDGLKWE